MRIFLRYVLLTLLLLLAFTLYLHREVSEEARFVTSEKCQDCHRSHFDSWRENTLHPYVFLPVDHPDAKILGDFDSGDPIVTFKKEEVEFVIGRKWEQVYVRIIDGEYYPFPARWHVIEKRWAPYKAKEWHDTPMSYKCNGCHTTGFDTNTLEFAEFGVGCEACHGPGSIHVQNKTRKHEATCKLCHEDEGLEHESAKDQDIIRSVSASVCGQCHNRGSTPGGDPTRGEEFSFPADFKLGDDIRSTSFNPSTPENDENGDNWWGNGLSKNRHQEFSDWSKSGHSRALSNLLASHAEKGSKHGPVTDKCLHCHSTDYRHTIEGDKPTLSSARFGITCVACHEPHGHDKKKPGFGDGSSTCGECHVMSMASGDKKHIPCPDERVTCADCHMPRIAITGGFFSLRSHSFNIIKPMSSIENDMPNSCQNSGCHDDRNLQWAIDAYKKFYGEDDIARQ